MRKNLFLAIAVIFTALFLTVPNFKVSAAGYSINIDGTYIKRAVVSETAVKLSADIRTAEGQKVFDKKLVWSIVSGNENVLLDGDLLYVKNAGLFTVKAEIEGEPNYYSQIDCEAFIADFSNVRIFSSFENVTVYTQPILLTGMVDIVGIVAPDDCHYELIFNVISGPASIYSDKYLKINGAGKVCLECYSRYDYNTKQTVEFTVTDPDEGKTVSSDFSVTQNTKVKGKTDGGCNGSVSSTCGFIALAMLAFGLKAKKKNSQL